MCGRRNSFRASKGSFPPQRVIFTCYVGSATSKTLWTLRSNSQFKQLPARYGCYVPFRATSKTLWMLRCNSHFKQLPGRYGCYVVTSMAINFEDALDATFQEPFQATSRTLWRRWIPRCNMYFKQVRRRFGCDVATGISSNFTDALDASVKHAFQASSKTLNWMLRCNNDFRQLQ